MATKYKVRVIPADTRPTKYAVFDETGCQCSAEYANRDYAQTLADRRNAVGSHRTKRTCMTCERPFKSQGPHNRMCDTCRGLPTAGADHSVVGMGVDIA